LIAKFVPDVLKLSAGSMPPVVFLKALFKYSMGFYLFLGIKGVVFLSRDMGAVLDGIHDQINLLRFQIAMYSRLATTMRAWNHSHISEECAARIAPQSEHANL
jgi:hypothetical protein